MSVSLSFRAFQTLCKDMYTLFVVCMTCIFVGALVIIMSISWHECQRLWQRRAPSQSTSMLAVSAYWDLKGKSRKSSQDDYYKTQMEKTTQFNADYAFFAERDVTTLVKCFREGKMTRDVELSWSDLVFMCEQKFRCMDILEKLKATSLHRDHVDGETHCPSAELLLVWLSKVVLVEKSMELWPSYTHYGWIDAGYKGLDNHMPSDSPWPSQDLSKVSGFYIKTDSSASKELYWKRGMRTAPIGCMWFGDKHACKVFVQTCIRIISERVQNGLTLCADQDVFALAIKDMQDTTAITLTIVGDAGYAPFWV